MLRIVFCNQLMHTRVCLSGTMCPNITRFLATKQTNDVAGEDCKKSPLTLEHLCSTSLLSCLTHAKTDMHGHKRQKSSNGSDFLPAIAKVTNVQHHVGVGTHNSINNDIDYDNEIMLLSPLSLFSRRTGWSPNASSSASGMGEVLARWARAGHLFFTIPHPCLFFPPLTKQSGVPSRSV